MRKGMKLVALTAGVAAATLALAAPASALRSTYQKAGYSEDVLDRTTMQVCDTQADGNGVYTNWWEVGWENYNSLRNSQGAGTCSTASHVSDQLIRAHIVWIDLRLRPDPHGPYVSY